MVKRDNSKTAQAFADFGLSNEMHVWESGCGPGEVTELPAEIVGSCGQILGVIVTSAFPPRIGRPDLFPADVSRASLALPTLSQERARP